MKRTALIFKCFVLLISVLLIFNFCGCSSLFDMLTTKEVPEEELEIIWGRDGDTYIYSDKIELFMSSSLYTKDVLYL